MIQPELSIYDLDDRHILPVAEGTPLGSIYLESRNDEEPLPQHRHLDGMITLVAPDGLTIEWVRPGDKIYYVDGQRVRRVIYAADLLAANSKGDGDNITNELLPEGSSIRFTSRADHQNVVRLNVQSKSDHQHSALEVLPAERTVAHRRCGIRSEARRGPSHRPTEVVSTVVLPARRVA